MPDWLNIQPRNLFINRSIRIAHDEKKYVLKHYWKQLLNFTLSILDFDLLDSFET